MIWPMVRLAAAVFYLCCGMHNYAAAVTVAALYHAQTVVTGTGEAERARGIQTALEDVLIKLTGDVEMKGSARIAPLLDNAASFVQNFSYEDRMKDLPVRDEQGTRDRPHLLRIVFDKEKLDAAMREAGLKIWPDGRPRIAVWLGVKQSNGSYVLSREGPQGYGQREAIMSAAARRGVPVILPDLSAPGMLIDYEIVAKGDAGMLKIASKPLEHEALLFGTLEFDGNAYWNMKWTLLWRGQKHYFDLQGVTFDKALSEGVERSAKVISASAH